MNKEQVEILLDAFWGRIANWQHVRRQNDLIPALFYFRRKKSALFSKFSFRPLFTYSRANEGLEKTGCIDVFMKTNFQFLHEKALHITQQYLRAESDLIVVLQKIDNSRGYREIGFKSLFEYATQGLSLSESVSYNLITIARKSKEVPKLQEMIREQEITISNARTIAPILTSENQEKWLATAATSSKRELEKEIAKEFPQAQVREQARYVSGRRIELKLGISEDLHEKLKRVQDLVSTQSGNAASLEETLEAALALFIEKRDPLEKAHRAEALAEKNKGPVPVQVRANPSPNPNSNPRFIPAWIVHAIRRRDQGQCTYLSSHGVRCSQRRWLEIHHIQPLALGGKSTLENLRLICRGHHQVLHH